MIVASLSHLQLKQIMGGTGLNMRVGPFTIRLKSRLADVVAGIHRLYADYPLVADKDFIDFHVSVDRPRNLRRWIRPQAEFRFDCRVPFKPLPLNQAFPFFEWGLNWCVAQNINTYLVFHSAVVEKNGKAVLFPGEPGAGKSTLCAALVASGWRLLSDEMAMVSPEDGYLKPVPRPVSLKNESIGIMKQFAPHMVYGREAADTTKGTVAHMKVPPESINKAGETAAPAHVVLPCYKPGSAAVLQSLPRAETLMHLVKNSFNYNVLGLQGFETACKLVDQCQCHKFSYSKLEQAISIFDQLVAD